MTALEAPQPRPGVLDIAPYVPGTSEATGATRSSSSPRTRRRSARARGGRGLSRQRRPPASLPGRRRHALRDAIAADLRPQPGAHRLRQRLRRASDSARADLSRPRRRGDLLAVRIPGLQRSRSTRSDGTPVVAPETNDTTNVDAILGARHAADEDRLSRQPQQPDRHLSPLRGDEPAACRPAGNVLLVLDAAYAEYVRRNDYASGVELAGTAANVIMTRTFSKIFGLAGAPHRLGLWPGARHRCAEPHPRPLQRLGPRIAAGAAALRRPGAPRDSGRAQRGLAAETDRRGRQGSACASRRASAISSSSISRRSRAATPTAADAFLRARGLVLRRVAGYGFPNALRMTVGTEEANERSIAALGDFMGKR